MASYDLTLAAEEDLMGIWRYTFVTWGLGQADKYLGQLGDCFDAIGSRRTPPRSLPQLPDEVCMHPCQRHYIFWLQSTARASSPSHRRKWIFCCGSRTGSDGLPEFPSKACF